jgi:hypothetical protein
MSNTLPISIRDWNRVGDSDFIYSTWIRSFADSGYARAIPKPIYNLSQRGRIEGILDKEETYCLVACDAMEPTLIYGWLVGEAPNIIHYIYCKMDYRQQGVGKALLEHLDKDEPILYTHKPTPIWAEGKLKSDKQLGNWLYDPYWMERER